MYLMRKFIDGERSVSEGTVRTPFSGLKEHPYAFNERISSYMKVLGSEKLGIPEELRERDMQVIWEQLFPARPMPVGALKERFEIIYLLYISIGGVYLRQPWSRPDLYIMAETGKEHWHERSGGLTAQAFFDQDLRVGICADLSKFFISALLSTGAFSAQDLFLVKVEAQDHMGFDDHYIVQVRLSKDMTIDVDTTLGVQGRGCWDGFFSGFTKFQPSEFTGKKRVIAAKDALYEQWAHYGETRYTGLHGKKDTLSSLFYLQSAFLNNPHSQSAAYNLAQLYFIDKAYSSVLEVLSHADQDIFSIQFLLMRTIVFYWYEMLEKFGAEAFRMLRPYAHLLRLDHTFFTPENLAQLSLSARERQVLLTVAQGYKDIEDGELFVTSDEDIAAFFKQEGNSVALDSMKELFYGLTALLQEISPKQEDDGF